MTIRLELLNKLKSLAAWPPTPKISPGRYLLRADGAAKNNPGHAGAGIVIFDPQDQVFLAKGWYLGRLTNNAAEWEALVLGLTIAKAQGLTHLEVALDSELVVKQFLGVYRVRSEGLIPYWREARNLALGFSNFRIGHVYREKNKDADRLASQAALKGAKGELAVLADLELDPDLAIKFGPQSDSQSAAKAPEKTPPEKNIDQPLEKSLDKQLEKQPKKQPEKPREKPLDKLLGQPKIEPLAQGPFAAKSLSQDNQNQDSQSPNSQKQENQNQDNQKAMVSPKSQNKNNISQSRETFSLFDNLVPETTKPRSNLKEAYYILQTAGVLMDNPEPAREGVIGLGPAGAGVIARAPNGLTLVQKAWYLGSLSHFMAEWQALLLGLKLVKELGLNPISLRFDSAWALKRSEDLLKFNNSSLLSSWREAQELLRALKGFKLTIEPNVDNQAATSLANQAARQGARGLLKINEEIILG